MSEQRKTTYINRLQLIQSKKYQRRVLKNEIDHMKKLNADLLEELQQQGELDISASEKFRLVK